MNLLKYILCFILLTALAIFTFIGYTKYKTQGGYTHYMKIKGGASEESSQNKIQIINNLYRKSNNHIIKILLDIIKQTILKEESKVEDMKKMLDCTKDTVDFAKFGYSENKSANECIVENVKDSSAVIIARNNLNREKFFEKKLPFTEYNNNLYIAGTGKNISTGISYINDEVDVKDGTFFKFRVYGLPNEVNSKTVGIVFEDNKPDVDIVIKSDNKLEDFTLEKAINLIETKYKIKNIDSNNINKFAKLHPLRTVPLLCK